MWVGSTKGSPTATYWAQSHDPLLRYPYPCREVYLSKWIAEWRGKAMYDEENEVCVLTWHGVLEPSSHRGAIDLLLRAQRHHRACKLVARQLALKAAGAMHAHYLARHRKRLMAKAAELIARSPELARWRFPRV